MNWAKRVSCGKASLRYAVLWLVFWVMWWVLALTGVLDASMWSQGFTVAMILNAAFTVLGVVLTLRFDPQERQQKN